MKIKIISVILVITCNFLVFGQMKKDLHLSEKVSNPFPHPILKKNKEFNPNEFNSFAFNYRDNFKPLKGSLLKEALMSLNIIEVNHQGIPVRFEAPVPIYPRTESKGNFWTAQLKEIIGIQNHKELNFKIIGQNIDELKIEHFKLQVYHGKYPVYGSELFIHEYPKQKIMGHGQIEIPNIAHSEPLLSSENAYELSKNYLETKDQKFASGNYPIQLSYGLRSSELVYYRNPESQEWHLTYAQHIMPNPANSWMVFVDGISGSIILAYPNMCKATCIHHVHEEMEDIAPDGPEIAQAKDLFGVTRTINTWKEGNTYYLIDGAQSMYNVNTSKIPDNPIGAIWTLNAFNTSPNQSSFRVDNITSTNNTWTNATSVSAHYNSLQAYNYFKNTHNRNSINGAGGTIISIINVADDNGGGLDNAFWNGEAMFYGNGRSAFSVLAKSLDVGGHEMSHGVIQNTANLTYQNESGAINESFADIFGVLIDRDDWKLGEDVVNISIFRSGALRDMSNPHNGTSQGGNGWQPNHVNEQYKGTEDNGGVHINSGITNYAFYLFIQELAKTRTEAQGKNIAEKIYYRALTNYLTRSSNFKDLRKAVQDAATDLHGANSDVVVAVGKAYDLVGIAGAATGGNNGSNYQKDLPINPGKEFLICTDETKSGVYLIDFAINKTFELSTTDIISKPSVSDDGSEIYFIAKDNTMRALFLDKATGNYEEVILVNSPIYRNIAVSKDGNLLAVLSKAENNLISIYNFTTQLWHEFTLYNPTYSQGVSTSNVRYADFMDFDHSGQYVMYDAYSEIKQQNGETYNYWDIGFVHVFDKSLNNFSDGKIEKLFSDLPEFTSIGNPVFSKNSPYIVAFDYLEESFFGTTYAMLGSNVETGDVQALVENRDETGYPNFNVKDNRIVYNGSSGNSVELKSIGLATGKITPSGSESTLVNGGYWGSYFANGKRVLSSTKEISSIENISYKPNPTAGKIEFTINSKNYQDIHFQIFNSFGKIVYQKEENIHQGLNLIEINLEGLLNGLYHVNVLNAEAVHTANIIKQN